MNLGNLMEDAGENVVSLDIKRTLLQTKYQDLLKRLHLLMEKIATKTEHVALKSDDNTPNGQRHGNETQQEIIGLTGELDREYANNKKAIEHTEKQLESIEAKIKGLEQILNGNGDQN